MPLTLMLSLVAVFGCVALVTGLVTLRAMEWRTPERRRIRDMAPTEGALPKREYRLVDTLDPVLQRLSATLPKSPKEMSGFRRQLVAAGLYDMRAAIYFSVARLVLPIILGGAAFILLDGALRIVAGIMAAAIGYLLPDLVLARMTQAHAKAIQNGLPDVLDLMTVCIEAGSSVDQSIVKSTEELELAHPALGRELRILITELRAGVPRLEAFRNFASRTRVDDVRALVTMLTQTDRFGTSVAEALRTHAEVSRTKRRQRAEEMAGKIGAKIVIPLALCIFPAMYAVCLGPLGVIIYRGLLI